MSLKAFFATALCILSIRWLFDEIDSFDEHKKLLERAKIREEFTFDDYCACVNSHKELIEEGTFVRK